MILRLYRRVSLMPLGISRGCESALRGVEAEQHAMPYSSIGGRLLRFWQPGECTRISPY
jgi:hypothetical protein